MTSVGRAATGVAGAVADHYLRLVDVRRRVDAEAAAAFARRDWAAAQALVTRKLDAYEDAVTGVVAAASDGRDLWVEAKRDFGDFAAGRPDREIAETFLNSCTRRALGTVGVDPDVEIAMTPPAAGEPDLVRYAGPGPEDVLRQVVTGAGLGDRWQNLTRDVVLGGEEIRRALRLHGAGERVDEAAMVGVPFYRGQGAYLVGSMRSGPATLPLAAAVHHTTRGLVVGAVLTEPEEVGVLFSYTRAAFAVATDAPGALVSFLAGLAPTRTRAELYTAIGFPKHGKTELYRGLAGHVAAGSGRFEHTRGIRGMVMIVFALPGHDIVFKVIRDRFPPPKETTRRRVMEKYRLVSRHDRAGRLVDASEFENLRLPADRFDPLLLDELVVQASRSVEVVGDRVVLRHVYVERRVVPLDLYVREANPVRAREAILDYGRAIKNLAAANVFPGDMLLKNFGVTRGGRVVFYDYDEITPLVDCNFRELPDSDRPEEEMSADPWFGVGDHDVFPEELSRFLGLRGELRQALDYHHGDLFEVRFWRRMQDRIRSGEAIDVFPYPRSRRIGARLRRIPGSPAP